MKIERFLRGAAFGVFFAAVLVEQHLWDETIMQSPDELTVSEFERNEYFLAVLPLAIEDMQEVLDFCDRIDFDEAAEMKFRAARVLRLLEDVREREAGRLA